MSKHTASRQRQVRIVRHADGSAAVDGVAVAVEPGQDVRDAAYEAAVRSVRGAAGPVAATCVEPDGTEYPLTLYPARAVFPADADTPAAGAGAVSGAASRIRARLRLGARLRPRMPPLSLPPLRLQVRLGARLQARALAPAALLRRLRPVPSLVWLAAAICGSVLLAVLATALLRQNDPTLVRLTVNQEGEAFGTPVTRSIGQGVAESAWHGMLGSTATVGARGSGPAAPTASPRAGARQPGAAGSTGAGGRAGAAGGPAGVSQAPRTFPAPAPGPRPRPQPAATAPLAVTDLTLALVGGDKSDPDIAYVITVSTDGPGPVTLAYGYAGGSGGAAVSRSVVLSGQTEYAVVDTIPGRPYCGGSLTMHAATSPAADNGAVTATTTSGC